VRQELQSVCAWVLRVRVQWAATGRWIWRERGQAVGCV